MPKQQQLEANQQLQQLQQQQALSSPSPSPQISPCDPAAVNSNLADPLIPQQVPVEPNKLQQQQQVHEQVQQLQQQQVAVDQLQQQQQIQGGAPTLVPQPVQQQNQVC